MNVGLWWDRDVDLHVDTTAFFQLMMTMMLSVADVAVCQFGGCGR